MCCSSTIRNVLSAGIVKPALPATTDAARAIVFGGAVARRRPSRPLSSSAFSARVHQIAALGLQLLQEGVVDRGVDEQVAVGRAARAVVVGLADPRVARRLDDVRGLVDRPSSRCRRRRRRPACPSCRPLFTIAGPPVAIVRSQVRISSLRERNARTLDALQQILRRAELAQRRAHHAHGFVRRLPAAGMRREDDGVLALDRVDRDADRRHVRAGHRNQRRDDAGRLRVLDDPLVGDLLDDADALLPQRVAQDALHLGAALRLGAAHAALVDAHLREPRRGRLVAAGPGDRAAQPIDRGLVVASRPRASRRGRGRAASARSPALRA